MIYDGKSGDIISQYIAFTRIFDIQVKKHGLTAKAVRETIRICRDKDILKKYLESRESEVVDIMLTLFSEDEIMEMYTRSERREAALDSAIKTTIEEGRYYGATKQDTAVRIREKFNISQDDADAMIKKYW